jgi:hypothetical protein
LAGKRKLAVPNISSADIDAPVHRRKSGMSEILILKILPGYRWKYLEMAENLLCSSTSVVFHSVSSVYEMKSMQRRKYC